MKELIAIQNRLKVLKDQSKDGIKYKYRTCEQIFQEVKPLCKEYGALLTVSDEIVMLGDRFYIKATASICFLTESKNLLSGEDFEQLTAPIEVTAYAREPDKLMSMSYPQITGSCSSYARKFALGGLFNLDDNHDPDGGNGETEDEPATKAQLDLLYKCVDALKVDHAVRAEGLRKLIVKDMFGDEADSLYNSACNVLGRDI